MLFRSYISSNYDGVSNPDIQGTWFNLTSYVPNWDTDNFDWDLVSSGNTSNGLLGISAYNLLNNINNELLDHRL